jgi:hypothetical protein
LEKAICAFLDSNADARTAIRTEIENKIGKLEKVFKN